MTDSFPATTPLMSPKNSLIALGLSIVIAPLMFYGLILWLTGDSLFSRFGIVFGIMIPISIFIRSAFTKPVSLFIEEDSLSMEIKGVPLRLDRNQIIKIKISGSVHKASGMKILKAVIVHADGKVKITDFSTVNHNAAVEALDSWWANS